LAFASLEEGLRFFAGGRLVGGIFTDFGFSILDFGLKPSNE
jgi:hypothetical protein